MCVFPLVLKAEDGGGGILSIQTTQKMQMIMLAISISLHKRMQRGFLMINLLDH